MKKDRSFEVKGKSIPKIVSEHLFTLFNFINFLLAAALLLAGSYKNLLFIGTVLCNFFLGVFWEIRAKLTLEKLRLVTQSRITVLRNGKEERIHRSELHAGDRVVIAAGEGAVCDGPVLEGKVKMDESSLTGEADPVEKTAGATVLSGTVALSGKAVMQAEKIDADCYAAGITRRVKGDGGSKSVMMRALKRIIFFLSVTILPLGALMLWRQTAAVEWNAAVVATAAALVGMIPDGLMLLTSTVLAIGVVKLAQKKVLVQELYSIESLARTDVVCLDKTGTLTTGEMQVEELSSWSEDFPRLLSLFARATRDGGATVKALKKHFDGEALSPEAFLPFDSESKYSALSLGGESLILGAGEFVGGLSETQQAFLREQTSLGRVLVLYRGGFDEKTETLTGERIPLGCVRLSDTLREGIREALDFFYSQKVKIKIISGDNRDTVSFIAAAAGVREAHKAVDCSLLSDEALKAAATEEVVFARVTPERKKLLVQALKEAGHTVAMTGDGINDVQALRFADCGVAPVSGTDGAKNAASLVMLDDDFCSLPHVVAQGRQSIGNIERSAGVFLTKTVLSAVLTLIFLLWGREYPFQPIQLTLISTTAIGLPSFLLGLEPSRDRIQGNFLQKIFRYSLPGGTAAALSVFGCALLREASLLSADSFGGACVLASFACVYTVLMLVMHPINRYRAGVALLSLCLFFGGFFLLGSLFEVRLPALPEAALCLGLTLLCLSLCFGVKRLLRGKKKNA